MKLKQIFRINLLCIWCSAIHPCRVVMNSNWGDFITRPTKHPLPKLSTLLVYYFCNQSVLQISYTKYTFSRLEV